MRLNQRDAVYNAVKQVLGERFPADGSKVEITKDERAKVHSLLVDGFVNKQIEFRKDEKATEEFFKKYVPGLTNNWLRKDKRLNGGSKYQAKNPGSRAGSGDESIQAMKALLAITKDAAARKDIENAIEKRKQEIKPKPEINIAALPDKLRHLVPQH